MFIFLEVKCCIIKQFRCFAVLKIPQSCCAQLVDISEGFLSLMLDNGDVREDLRVPDSDLGKEIESKFAAGEEMLVSASWHISRHVL